MPIYEYTCKCCGHEFEELVRGAEQPGCPSCGQQSVERRLSVPAAHTARAAPSGCPAQEMCGPGGCCGQGCAFNP